MTKSKFDCQPNFSSSVPFVFIPGFLGQQSDFDSFIESLRSQGISNPIEVYALKDWSVTDNGFPGWVAGFRAWLEQKMGRNEEPFIGLGYSLGGRLLLHSLVEHPERCLRAVIVSSHFGLQQETERSSRRENDCLWQKRFLTEPWTELIQQWNEQNVFCKSTPIFREEKDFDRLKLAKILEVFSLSRQRCLLPDLEALPQETLWLVGEFDRKFCLVADRLLASRAARMTTVQRVAGAGHRVLNDQPQRAAQLLCDFLKTI